jgi:hypothetical protein
MNTQSVRLSALVFIGVVAGVSLAATSVGFGKQPSTEGRQIVVIAEKKGSKAVWLIESRPIPKEDPRRVLREFGDLVEKYGPETDILILVEGTLPISEFQEISGLAGKAGFAAFRYFTFGSDRRYMIEIRFDQAIPFSTQPRTGREIPRGASSLDGQRERGRHPEQPQPQPRPELHLR